MSLVEIPRKGIPLTVSSLSTHLILHDLQNTIFFIGAPTTSDEERGLPTSEDVVDAMEDSLMEEEMNDTDEDDFDELDEGIIRKK